MGFCHYSGDGGAGPSIRIAHQALVDADCDWIIVCPCGFNIEDTKKEEELLSSTAWWLVLQPMLTNTNNSVAGDACLQSLVLGECLVLQNHRWELCPIFPAYLADSQSPHPIGKPACATFHHISCLTLTVRHV